MIRRLVDQAFNSGKNYISAVGLSTDVKPTEGIITGSKFVEVDTCTCYLFDETAGEWHKNQQLSEAVAAYLDEHPEAIDQAAVEALIEGKLDDIEDEVDGLKSAFDTLNEFVTGNDESYSENISVTQGTQILASAHIFDVAIEAGKDYVFEIKDSSSTPLISKFYLYVNGTNAGITCYVNTPYKLTAVENVTYLSIYVFAADAAGTGTVTATLDVLTADSDHCLENRTAALEKDSAYLLKSAHGSGIAPAFTMTEGGYINSANGNVSSNESYQYSSYISVVGLDKIGIVCTFADAAGYAFYTAQNVYISGGGKGAYNYGDVIPVDVPSGATSVRFSYLPASGATPEVMIYDIKSNLIRLDSKIDTNITGLRNETQSVFAESGIILDFGTLTDNGYINTTWGTVSSNESYKYTDYIPVYGLAKIGIVCCFGGSAGYAFYDENKSFLTGSGGGKEDYDYGDMIPVIVPKGAYYVRSSWIKSLSYPPSGVIYDIRESFAKLADPYTDDPCSYDGDEISTFNKIICIGDSLTIGVFNYRLDGDTNHYATYTKFSYPAVLAKITGVEVTNAGISGDTSDEWYAAYENTDLSGYDMAIIQLGVNDVGRYTTFGNTSKTAFSNIITKLKTENKNIKIFVANIIPATSYSSSGYLAFSTALLEWLEETYANDSNVIPVDIQQYGHTRDSAAYNCGHLSALGYSRLARDYKGFIGHYINTHKDQFSEIQFIGTDYQYHE